MKKIRFVVMVTLIICLILTGCSGGGKEPAQVEKDIPTTSTVIQDNSKLEDSKHQESNEVKSSSIQIGKSMELPAEFPVDILPLLDDAQINYILKNEDNKGINVTFATGKSLEEATTFYKEVMKDGEVSMEMAEQSSYVTWGGKGNYAVAISVTITDGKVYVMLDATPK